MFSKRLDHEAIHRLIATNVESIEHGDKIIDHFRTDELHKFSLRLIVSLAYIDEVGLRSLPTIQIFLSLGLRFLQLLFKLLNSVSLIFLGYNTLIQIPCPVPSLLWFGVRNYIVFFFFHVEIRYLKNKLKSSTYLTFYIKYAKMRKGGEICS